MHSVLMNASENLSIYYTACEFQWNLYPLPQKI
jgi:hypothetical protein